MAAHPLPNPLTVLAVCADDARHAPVRALLKSAEIEHVTTLEQALHALDDRRTHDVVARRPRDRAARAATACILAEELVRQAPARPVIVLSHTADQRGRRGGRRGRHRRLPARPRPERRPARARDPLRASPTSARCSALAESEERHALALRGANDGMWDWNVATDRVFYSARWKSMLGYREIEIGETRGEWLGRVHADDRAPLTQALDAYLHRHRRRPLRVRAPRPAPRRQLPLDARPRDRGARRPRHGDPRSSARSPTSPTAARPSAASSTTRSTTRSPASPTACCSWTASTSRSAAPSATTPSAAPRCCSSTSTASRSSTTASATPAGDQLLQGGRAPAGGGAAAERHGRAAQRRRVHAAARRRRATPREATVIAERVLHSLQAPFLIDGRELFIGASIGIALATAKSAPEQVMRDADVAMYRAKADGKGRHAVFDAAMHEQVMRRLDLEGDLRSAIEDARARGRLPADRAGRDGPHRRLRGALPLAATASRPRSWRWPTRPGWPIPLGRQVLRDRVRAARGVARAARAAPGLTIGVNVSARQLGEPGFVEMLQRDPRARPAWTRARCGSRSPSTT